MAKRLTITNTRPSYQTLWYFQTNPPQNTVLDEWLEDNNDKVTFHFDISSDMYTQVLEYTFTDDAVAEGFATLLETGNITSTLNSYNASVGIISTYTITDL
jgi:hypothetical protein